MIGYKYNSKCISQFVHGIIAFNFHNRMTLDVSVFIIFLNLFFLLLGWKQHAFLHQFSQISVSHRGKCIHQLFACSFQAGCGITDGTSM